MTCDTSPADKEKCPQSQPFPELLYTPDSQSPPHTFLVLSPHLVLSSSLFFPSAPLLAPILHYLLTNCHFPCSQYEGCDDTRIQCSTMTLRIDYISYSLPLIFGTH